MSTRKGNYTYTTKKAIPYVIFHSELFRNGELIVKEIDGLLFVLTYGEEQLLTEYICDEMAGLHFALYELADKLEKCKFDKETRLIVDRGLQIAIDKVESAQSDFHAVMYEHVVDIPLILKKSQGISPLKKKHRKTPL